jgi:hypothetical protein
MQGKKSKGRQQLALRTASLDRGAHPLQAVIREVKDHVRGNDAK